MMFTYFKKSKTRRIENNARDDDQNKAGALLFSVYRLFDEIKIILHFERLFNALFAYRQRVNSYTTKIIASHSLFLF